MSDPPTTPIEAHEVETYEICLRGRLDVRWAARLDVPSLTHETDGTTILRGIAADQAALHGLLQRVRDLGLTLVSVVRMGSTARTGAADQLPPSPLTQTRTPK
jgi:hypothetical protein